MVSGRPYSPARPREDVLDEIIRLRGRQFDPNVVEALVHCVTGPHNQVPDNEPNSANVSHLWPMSEINLA